MTHVMHIYKHILIDIETDRVFRNTNIHLIHTHKHTNTQTIQLYKESKHKDLHTHTHHIPNKQANTKTLQTNKQTKHTDMHIDKPGVLLTSLVSTDWLATLQTDLNKLAKHISLSFLSSQKKCKWVMMNFGKLHSTFYFTKSDVFFSKLFKENNFNLTFSTHQFIYSVKCLL